MRRLYVSWTDAVGTTTTNPGNNHARIQVAYSSNGGASWTVRTPHETADSMAVDRWHQWLKVDKNGVVHVTYYDTRQFTARNGVDMYHSYSTNGGNTWSVPNRLSSESSPAATGFQFGDYNGMDFGMSANEGIAFYADNRSEGGGSFDIDAYVSPIAAPIVSNLIFKNGFE